MPHGATLERVPKGRVLKAKVSWAPRGREDTRSKNLDKEAHLRGYSAWISGIENLVCVKFYGGKCGELITIMDDYARNYMKKKCFAVLEGQLYL